MESLTNEFDYVILGDRLKRYRYPRNRIERMLRTGEIVRVKKGIYVKGGADYNRFVLANMIYGPSYVSQQTSLSYFGLIPERVYAVTSVTLGKRKDFDTPVGTFVYEPMPPDIYPLGIKRVELSGTSAFLIATPEKAVSDALWRVNDLNSRADVEDYLFRNMRLELGIYRFSKTLLRQIARFSRKPFSAHLEAVLTETKRHD